MSFSSLALDKSLTDVVKALGYEQPTPIQQQAIPAILANKDIGGFLDAFEGLASAVIGISIPDHDSLAPETLRELATSRNMLGFVADSISDAVEMAIETGEALSGDTTEPSATPPRVLICGSLYLAGEVLKN